ncbi:MAG: hypothetical protein EZS28_021499, partial [Streblomastix strix]
SRREELIFAIILSGELLNWFGGQQDYLEFDFLRGGGCYENGDNGQEDDEDEVLAITYSFLNIVYSDALSVQVGNNRSDLSLDINENGETCDQALRGICESCLGFYDYVVFVIVMYFGQVCDYAPNVDFAGVEKLSCMQISYAGLLFAVLLLDGEYSGMCNEDLLIIRGF